MIVFKVEQKGAKGSESIDSRRFSLSAFHFTRFLVAGTQRNLPQHWGIEAKGRNQRHRDR
jgi:hypothetical protein